MATLCTEIGMPKYRENKKKRKSFLPGNVPANICHRQCLACVKVPASLYSMCHPRVWLCTRFWMLRDTYSCRVREARSSVYKSSECVCLSMHSHTHTHRNRHLCFYMYIQKPPLLISCTFCSVHVKERITQSVREAIHTSKASSFTPILVGVCSQGFARVDARVCVCVCVFQHAIKMSNGSCSLFTLQPSFLPREMCLPLVIEELGLSLTIIYQTAE